MPIPGPRGSRCSSSPSSSPTQTAHQGPAQRLRDLSLEHKLGIHASPTCVISFGEGGEGALGYVVGEVGTGMRNMFTMMNAARVGVGMEGVAVSGTGLSTGPRATPSNGSRDG